MLRVFWVACFSVLVWGQTPSLPPVDHVISGTVTNAATADSLIGRTVAARLMSRERLENGTRTRPGGDEITTETDGAGNYSFHGLTPGEYSVRVVGDDLTNSNTSLTLNEGWDAANINFAVRITSSISGMVTDKEKQPIADVEVVLLEKVYRAGRTAYTRGASARTNAKGLYKMNRQNVIAGAPYLVLAMLPLSTDQAEPQVSEDPASRPLTLMPTYYPNAHFADGAIAVTALASQPLEGIDIRMDRTPSYCIEGSTLSQGVPAPMTFRLTEAGLSNGTLDATELRLLQAISNLNSALQGAGGNALRKTAEKGKFRLCGLHPGDYQFEAVSDELQAKLLGVEPVTIVDKDVHGLAVDAVPAATLSASARWDETPPKGAASGSVALTMMPLSLPVREVRSMLGVPGTDLNMGVRYGDYVLQAVGTTTYVKDVTYGGVSVLGQRFHWSGGMGRDGVVVSVSAKAGSIAAKLVDSQGHAVAKGNAWVIPSRVQTAAEMEMTMSECTFADGACELRGLPPGMYFVLATSGNLEHTAAQMDRLWANRIRGKRVELDGDRVDLTLEVSRLY